MSRSQAKLESSTAQRRRSSAPPARPGSRSSSTAPPCSSPSSRSAAPSARFEITKDFASGATPSASPIAANQAIKHRMADLWCKVELARSNATTAPGRSRTTTTGAGTGRGAIARISACEAFDDHGRENIQFHGGVGYTWEYDCHLFYRRAKLLSLGPTSAALIDRGGRTG